MFYHKTKSGWVDRARSLVRGFLKGLVEDVYAPVVDFTSVRTALTVAVQKDFCLRQLDVRTALLHGDIDQLVFISPPSGLEEMGIQLCKNGEVLKLQKGLYGLRQASRLWHKKWKGIMKRMGSVSFLSD